MLAEVLAAAAAFAKPFEGLRLAPYHDCSGYPTIGYGHLLSRVQWEDLSRYPRWTREEALAALERDMTTAARAAISLCPGARSVEQLAALTDFAYNLGSGCLQRSTLRSKLNRGDIDGAANEFLRFTRSGGIVRAGLVRRCEARRALFLLG